MRSLSLFVLAAAASAHGGSGRDASDGVPQVDADGLSSLIARASAEHTAAFVRFYMNS